MWILPSDPCKAELYWSGTDVCSLVTLIRPTCLQEVVLISGESFSTRPVGCASDIPKKEIREVGRSADDESGISMRHLLTDGSAEVCHPRRQRSAPRNNLGAIHFKLQSIIDWV